MNRGIVMEMKEKSLIVMTPDGKFDEIARTGRDCEIGEEIVYAAPAAAVSRRQMVWASGLVAAVVFCFVVFTGIKGALAVPEVVAYVSMDINPSVELGIDAKEKVRELRGLNSDGINLIQNLVFKGKGLADVTEELLKRADLTVLKQKDDADIVIASTKVKTGANLDENQLTLEMEQKVKQHIQKEYPERSEQFVVTAFSAPTEARDTASENGLSTGKMTIYLKAKENGQDVSLNEFKDKSVHDIAKDYGGISSFIGTVQIKKDDIRQLVTEEKNGTLERKQQEKQKEHQDDAKKNGSRPSSTPSASPKVSTTPSFSPPATPRQGSSQTGNNQSDNGRQTQTPKSTPKPTPKQTQKTDDTPKPTKKPDDNNNNDNNNDNRNNGNNGNNGNNKNGNDQKPTADKPKSADDRSQKPDDKPKATQESRKDDQKNSNQNNNNQKRNDENNRNPKTDDEKDNQHKSNDNQQKNDSNRD